jgi:uncharacterized membrane protein HdeD (DUF308 family)
MTATTMERRSRAECVEVVTSYLVTEVGLSERDARMEAEDLLRDAGVAHGYFSKRWWVLVLRGVLAIAVGLLFVARPVSALASLVVVLGAWILVDGVIAIAQAISQRRAWHVYLEGAIGILIGYLILTRPVGAAMALLVLTAAWSIGRGISEIAIGAGMRRGEPGRGTLVFVGIVSFLFGIVLIAAPLLGVVTLGWWLGAYALAYGAMLIVLGFQVRRVKEEVREAIEPRIGGPLPYPTT